LPSASTEIPFDIDLEQAVIGTMIARKGMIDKLAGEISSAHFHDPLHARIFDMAVYLQTEGEVTPTIMASVLRNDPAKSENLDVAEYVRSLASASPSLPGQAELKLWTAELKDLALRRRLHQIGGDLRTLALENPDDIDALNMADQATEELLLVANDNQRPLKTPYELAQEANREIEDAWAGRTIPVLKTGLGALDNELGGIRGGDLITILGKSGMGKSALMCRMSWLMASSGIPTIVFSLEMSARQWIERVITDIDYDANPTRPMWYSRVRNHDLRNNDEFDRFVLAGQRLQNIPLQIVDDGGMSMAQISARSRAFAARHKGKRVAVFADYLQLVQPVDQRENRERQVARIAYDAKALAKRIDAPVIFGSQMNEQDEQRAKEERRPRASDARESRGIMNASDLMIAPYRPAVAIENRKPLGLPDDAPDMIAWQGDYAMARHQFDLLGLKNRHGRRFDLRMFADMAANAIRDEDPRHQRAAATAEEVQSLLV
jgi:replicative DNA helicase